MSYFVIKNSDGNTSVSIHTEQDLKKKLADEYWGDVDFMSHLGEKDTNYWGNNILIIKGEVVVPQAVQKVIEYKL